MERKYWLKSVGSASDEEAADWPDSGPRELSQVHFANRGKPSVQTGDYLVYYTAAQQKILGVVEVYMPPTKDSPEERRPWRCQIKLHLMLATIEGAPSVDVLSEAATEEQGTIRRVGRMSHMTLNKTQYQRALTALEGAFVASRGDMLGDWPMFRTRLSPSRAQRQTGD